VALRRFLALALVAAGLAAGLALGAATGSDTSTAATVYPCPLATPTTPCCGPPLSAQRTVAGAAQAVPCPGPCGTNVCTLPEPTVPVPAPAVAPKLTIPKGGLTVRRGRFKVTCTMSGVVGPCTVTARHTGKKIGSGHRNLGGGKARVTVKLLRAASTSLTRHRHMKARLTGTAGGKHTTVTATLKTS
jgi:hypothetical protein